jgi:RNA polymerase sigma-70 factor (sigma-E family)
MAQDRGVEDLDRFLAVRGRELLRAAALLTGSRAAGEDLLQAALERLLRRGQHIDGDPEGYLRRIMYNLAADGWRRQAAWRGKLALLRVRDADAVRDDTAQVDLRDTLVRLLAQLPPRQRAVLVLRYWEQRTEAESAALLGCSEGAVKAAAARGIRRLRELTAQDRPGGGELRLAPAERNSSK